MKKIFVVIFALLSVSLFAQESNEPKYLSYWEGDLKINSMSLKLIIKIFENDDKSIGAYLDSPNQGAKNIAASSVRLSDDSLIVSLDMIGGSLLVNFRKTACLQLVFGSKVEWSFL